MRFKLKSLSLLATPLFCFAQGAPLVLNVPVELKNMTISVLDLRCDTGTSPLSRAGGGPQREVEIECRCQW
jgi:hypothetical protein